MADYTKEEIKRRTAEEKKRISAHRKKIAVLMKDKVRCRVQNLEDPGKGIPLEFTYQGHNFFFNDGFEYDVPKIVAEHLNSITVPVYDFQLDEKDVAAKQMISVPVGVRNRFSCIPVSTFQGATKA